MTDLNRPSVSMGMEPLDPAGTPSSEYTFYDVDADELWTLPGASRFTPSPHDDVGIANIDVPDSGEAEIAVFVDLDARRAEGLLPFPVVVLDWPEPERIFLRARLDSELPDGWTPGVYELRTDSNTIALVEASRPFTTPAARVYVAPLSADSAFPRGSELRVLDTEIILVSGDDQRTVVEGRATAWTRDRTQALVVQDDRTGVFDTVSGTVVDVDLPEGTVHWSPQGDTFAVETIDGLRLFDAGGNDLGYGPHDAAVVSWSLDGDDLLVSTRRCEPGGFQLSVMDVATGGVRQLTTGPQEYWTAAWSPNEQLIATAGHDLPVKLLDPVDGSSVESTLSRSIGVLQDFEWSATGRFLVLRDHLGRQLC